MLVNNKLSYITIAIVVEKELMTNFAWETTKLLCKYNFAY